MSTGAMTDVDHLERDDIRRLRAILATVPGLVADLLNVECRTAVLSRPVGGSRPKPGSTIPYNMGASDTADVLHGTLVAWVRHTISERGGAWPGNNTISLAAWLYRNAEAVALCEGSLEIVDEIEYACKVCRQAVDIPDEDGTVVPPLVIEAARKQIVTALAAAKIAPSLGKIGVGLNVNRVDYLARKGKITGWDPESGGTLYYLGDILDAHVEHLTMQT